MVIMKKLAILLLFVAQAFAFSAEAQENQIKRLPDENYYSGNNQSNSAKSNAINPQTNYYDNDNGFWWSAELSAAYSCRILNSNFGFSELDATAGYRFNQFARIGLGFGARCYFDNNRVRYGSEKWGFPIYVNVRGNFIPTDQRDFVPYYSVDMGGTVRDGFLMRPTIGLRIGQNRSAMLIGLGYVGQHLTSFSYNNMGQRVKKGRFVSFISLRVGYEF